MGFQASEAVEELTYDFNPYVDAAGKIPEPTAKQVDSFRRDVAASAQALGLSAEDLKSGKIGLEQMGELMEKAGAVEAGLLAAIADLTGIAHQTLNRLPYRVQASFSGYIVGLFLRPEA